jgi:hypothetical protein
MRERLRSIQQQKESARQVVTVTFETVTVATAFVKIAVF